MKYSRRRRGIALVFVLIIGLVGMTLLGVMMSSFSMLSGSARAAVAKDTRFNSMEAAIEQAKAALKKKMKETGEVLAWDSSKLAATGKITSADELIVCASNDAFGMFEPRTVWVNGQEGELHVRIYDMLYDVDKVPGSHTDAGMTEPEYEAFLASLPPSASVNIPSEVDEANPLDLDKGNVSEKMGAYLIRAILNVGGKKKVIETAVVQGIE